MSLRVFEIEIDTSKSFRIFISREKSCLRNFSLSQQKGEFGQSVDKVLE